MLLLNQFNQQWWWMSPRIYAIFLSCLCTHLSKNTYPTPSFFHCDKDGIFECISWYIVHCCKWNAKAVEIATAQTATTIIKNWMKRKDKLMMINMLFSGRRKRKYYAHGIQAAWIKRKISTKTVRAAGCVCVCDSCMKWI